MILQRLSNAVSRHLNLSHLAVILVLAASVATCLTGCDNGCEQTRESFLHLSFTPTKGYKLRRITALCTSGSHQYELKPISAFDDVKFELDPSDSIATLTLECTYEDYGDLFMTKGEVVVNYTSQPTFLDLSCGCTMVYRITNVQLEEHSDLDDKKFFLRAIISDDEIRPESGINIKIEY